MLLFGGVGYCCWMVKANQLMLSKMPDLYKVGWTDRNPIVRAKELTTTGLPDPFKVVYEHKTNLTMEIEKMIHKALDSYRPVSYTHLRAHET